MNNNNYNNDNTKLLQSFCIQNKLSFVITQRIQKLRRQLAKFFHSKLSLLLSLDNNSNNEKQEKWNYNNNNFITLSPPNPMQEKLLLQSYVSGTC